MKGLQLYYEVDVNPQTVKNIFLQNLRAELSSSYEIHEIYGSLCKYVCVYINFWKVNVNTYLQRLKTENILTVSSYIHK